jgi:hypothetical protein
MLDLHGDVVVRRVLIAALAGVLVAGETTTPGSAQVDWSTAWMVQYRTDHGMAYDTARDRIVVFGGRWNGRSLGDTWEWDGTDWTQMLPSVSPPARTGAVMTYDAARRVVVMFGGRFLPSGEALTDTWEWDGATWMQRFPERRPSLALSLTYDIERSRVVGIFDGPPDGIWEWDGASWTFRAAVGVFVSQPIAYDATRQVCVLAGFDGTQGMRTYVWDGTSLVASVLLPTVFGLMVDDPGHGYVLGLGGVGTWAWDGSQWTNVSAGSVASQNRVIFDPMRGRPVAMGMGKTFEWDGETWVTRLPFPAPPSSGNAGQNLAYDDLRKRVVFAGQGTWEWDGTAWEQKLPPLQPPALAFTAVTYSRPSNRVVLFGGSTSSGRINDTWLWDGASWTLASPTTSPAARYLHALAFDSERDRVVLFGGYADGSTSLGDTWEFDGSTWIQLVPLTNPAARSSHGLAHDSVRRRTVLFGGIALQGRLQDTWEWDGSNWEQRFPANSPSARDWHGMVFDASRARIVLFGGLGNGSTQLNDTWEWDGTDWTQRTTTNSPPPRHALALAYDSARREVICYGGIGSTQDTWHYAPTDPATYTTSQSGCPGSAGIPTLTITSPSGYPWLGETFSVDVTNLAPGSPVAMAAGFSSTQWAGIPLPLALDFIGMFGCQALCSAEFFFPAGSAGPSGTATWSLGPLPNDSAFLGFRLFTQAWIADGVNPAGLIVSDLGEAVVGGK